MNPTHPLVDAYLDRLDALLYGASSSTRSEVLAGVREHLHDSLTAAPDEREVRRVLTELGTPEQIADEAYAHQPGRVVAGVSAADSPSPHTDRSWLPWSVMMLGLLTLLLFLFLAVPWLNPIELVLAMVYTPSFPAFALLVVVARSWSVREKLALIGCMPLVCLMVFVVGTFVPTDRQSAWPDAVSQVVLLLGAIASAVVIVRLGRRGVRSAR